MSIFTVIFQGFRIIFHGIRFNIFFNPKGKNLSNFLENLGPIFIKFGQLLSTRSDILDTAIINDLGKLTDQCKPFSSEKARAIIEKELGSRIENNFLEFNMRPIAAASLAQVHSARLKNGKSIVIKVLRPNIHKKVRNNIKLLKACAKIFKKLYKESYRLKPIQIINDYESTIQRELDLRLEAANTNLTRKNFINANELYIPEVYWDLTTSNVMVLEKIDGIPCTDIDEIEKKGIDKKTLAENGVMIFLNQVFRDNFFHADMHPGNIFVSKDASKAGYIAIDCAIVGSLSNNERFTLARMLQSVLKQNYSSLAKLFISSEWVNSDTNQLELENTLRACCEPIFEKPLNEIEFGKLLLYLFQSTRRYGLSIQPSLVLLQKTLIHIEGMGRQIYPELNFWSIAEPYLDDWLKKQFDPRKIPDYLSENKEEILSRFKDMPENFFEVLDSIRHYSKNKIKNEQQLLSIKDDLKTEKIITRGTLVAIIILCIYLILSI